MSVMTREHVWVKHVITPVSVLHDDQGEPVVIVDPDQEQHSQEAAVYGCAACGEAMATVHGKECDAPASPS